ncbi:MAG: HD domain-containing protein [Methanosarcina sp.]|nr:MAG: HD domain-containing protein [Methanosarcina sp.]
MSDYQSSLGNSGPEFMKSLYHLINNVRIYQDNNQLISRGVEQFKSILDKLTGEDDSSIHLWRGRLHVHGEKIPYSRDIANVINFMVEYFTQRRIGRIIFLKECRNALPENIPVLVRLLNDSVMSDDPPVWLEIKLREYGFSWVQIFRKQDDKLSNAKANLEERRYEKARNTYIHAVETVKEVAQKVSKGIVGVRKARRLAQNMVDLIGEDTSLMLGLASIKDYDDYTYVHSVNVALLATCLGKQINLSDISLEHLSVCGLFHDLGKVGVSKGILLKEGELSVDEWAEMKEHPLIGVRKILMLNAPHKLRSKIILGPFEHHRNLDFSGYPQTLFMNKLSLTGKILRIVDVYEALTSQRIYRSRAFAPDEALRKMWSVMGKSFEPVLLKSFIKMMGIYPIGSIVELSDGNIALVMDYPEDSQKELPLLLLLAEDSKGRFIRGDMIYLPDQAMKDASPRLNIVRGINPAQLGIQVAEFFLHEK